ncbi:hypothetical protein WJX84_010230 [Apatococcus fuscideae]
MGVSKEVQDDVFKVLLTVKPIFPNPWWRRLWQGASKTRRERHTREMEAIALPKATAAGDNQMDPQQHSPEGSQNNEADGQHQQSFSVSASSVFEPGYSHVPSGASPASSSLKCPAA